MYIVDKKSHESITHNEHHIFLSRWWYYKLLLKMKFFRFDDVDSLFSACSVYLCLHSRWVALWVKWSNVTQRRNFTIPNIQLVCTPSICIVYTVYTTLFHIQTLSHPPPRPHMPCDTPSRAGNISCLTPGMHIYEF